MSEQSTISVDIHPHEKGQLKAFVDVTIKADIGEMTIMGFRIIHKDGDSPWVAFPKMTYTTKHGEQKDRQFLSMAPRNLRKITEAILKEWQGT